MICTGDEKSTCATLGSLRRIGGQGDIMAGSIATFLAWGRIYARDPDNSPLEHDFGHLSAFAGATLMRSSAFEAFKRKGRGLGILITRYDHYRYFGLSWKSVS